MLLSDLSVPDPVFDTISFAILHAFRSVTHSIHNTFTTHSQLIIYGLTFLNSTISLVCTSLVRAPVSSLMFVTSDNFLFCSLLTNCSRGECVHHNWPLKIHVHVQHVQLPHPLPYFLCVYPCTLFFSIQSCVPHSTAQSCSWICLLVAGTHLSPHLHCQTVTANTTTEGTLAL